MTLNLHVQSTTEHAKEWLVRSRDLRVLHVFEHTCNLINEQKDVVSVVTPQIGNGPFNLVVDKEVCFLDVFSLETSVIIDQTRLALGEVTVHTTATPPWNPRPDWERLHARRVDISKQVIKLDADFLISTRSQFSNPFVSILCSALASANIISAQEAASKLAGLGPGLTPSGDDAIMGAMYAAWIIHPPETARALSREIAETAATRTTSLSAAWLRSAGRGEAGILWHRLFDALLSVDAAAIQFQIKKLLSVGHTSGADALAGFMTVFHSRRACIQDE